MKDKIKKILKNNFKIIKEHFIILFGIGSFTYGLFSFSNGVSKGLSGCIRKGGIEFEIFNHLPECPSAYPVATYYYYNQ